MCVCVVDPMVTNKRKPADSEDRVKALLRARGRALWPRHEQRAPA